jgi:predicted PolB exonuclease-like 3'-5' exonuclease
MWDLGDISDEAVASAMFFKQQQKTGSDFLPLHQHRIVAISVALRTGDTFRVWSLGEEESDEAELVRRFYDGIDRYTPDLVSWNGGGFDLPVLHYRALKHGVQAPRYWELGDSDREFRYNNYLSRFHWRHVDLMDVLAGYQLRARASLDQAAVLLGYPGKLGMSGDKVWDRFLAGGIKDIRDYCETDVVNTWLVYLRFEHMRGNLDSQDLDRELALVRETRWSRNRRGPRQESLCRWRAGGRRGSVHSSQVATQFRRSRVAGHHRCLTQSNRRALRCVWTVRWLCHAARLRRRATQY